MVDKQLILEVKEFIKYMEAPQVEEVQKRKDKSLNPEEMYISLRNREREDNIKFIIQYLLFFLQDIPVTLISELEVNPYEQFRSFVIFQIKLLKDIDVIKAIIRDGQYKDSLSNWDAMEQLKGKVFGSLQDCYHGFMILGELCQLWFDIRYKNNFPIRHCDILTYKLTQTLIKKLEKMIPNE
jgi:hypothetical protein